MDHFSGDTAISTATTTDVAFQRCISPNCNATFDVGEVHTSCPRCGDLLDIRYDWDRVPVPVALAEFEARWANRRQPLDFSGVWRFRELLPFAPPDKIVTIGEGQTILQQSASVARYCGMKEDSVFLQYEGLNPSGSFKDNGMTAAVTHANMVGAKQAACASTGNTSASLAIFGSCTGLLKVLVFVGSGKIAYGKLSQALDYGAKTIQLLGDFDDAMQRVREVCSQAGIYLCNSLNPFRLEGQKAIIFRILESLAWEPPDWIVVPGGNLGNTSAFGKALMELKELGLIDRVPRLAVINAAGANTLHQLYERDGLRWNDGRVDAGLRDGYFGEMESSGRRAATLASAIEINRPVNLSKALRSLDFCDGIVSEVNDQQILDGKAQVGAGGFGCEPASGASVAGVKLLREEGVIAPSDRVACILTGHQLKDPNVTVAYHSGQSEDFDRLLRPRGVETAAHANQPVVVENELEKILEVVTDIG